MLKSSALVLISFVFIGSLFMKETHEAIKETSKKTVAAEAPVVGDYPCCPTETDLANISLHLALADASHMLSDIQMMLNNQTWDPSNKTCLESCVDLYNCALASLNEAADSFKDQNYTDISGWVQSARECAEECEADFSGVSPLTTKNNYFFQLCQVAFDISFLLA